MKNEPIELLREIRRHNSSGLTKDMQGRIDAALSQQAEPCEFHGSDRSACEQHSGQVPCEQAPAQCPICDANEVVELRTKHCLKCDADFAGADEMSANKAAVLAARAKRIEPAPAQDEQPAVFWVLFDATGPERFIKKDVSDGTLAFFDSEDEAQRAKRRHPGTDYKRVEYYRAPIAQTEQQPVAFLYYDDSDVDADLKLKPFVLVVGNEGPEQHLARRKPGTQGVKPLYAAPIAQTAPQPEQSGLNDDSKEAAMQKAFELGGLEDGSYHLESDELELVIRSALSTNGDKP